MIGSWVLVEGSGLKKDATCIRHITGTHDSWTYFHKARKTPGATAGGPYVMRGREITVTFEYASGGYEHLLSEPQTLTYRVNGDVLSISGRLPKGEVRQKWKRLK